MSASSLFWLLCRQKKLFASAWKVKRYDLRTILTKAYSCDDAWNRQLQDPILKNIKMNQYFIEVDKKFQTKGKASGVDIDLFANNVKEESELDELEHLLYRFRRTKRCIEILDSTTYATIRAFLKLKKYGPLLRILSDRQDYGIFPDHYGYNIIMDTFLENKHYRAAARIAVLMMQQEDFSNPINRILGLYSCQMFMNEYPIESLHEKEADEEVKDEDEAKAAESQKNIEEDEDEEEVFVRVPFLKNPWFDDHFDIKDPKHLIGKTFYLIGKEEDNILGRSYQLLGLGMYEKWEKAKNLLDNWLESSDSIQIFDSSVSKFNEALSQIADEESKTKQLVEFEDKFRSLKENGKIVAGDITIELQRKLQDISNLEEEDIKSQEELFSEWMQKRKETLTKQQKDLDRERRLQIIAEKKEYLYWKEKELFFFERQEEIMEELKKAEEMIEMNKAKLSPEETYKPPEIIKKPPVKISRLRRKARVTKL